MTAIFQDIIVQKINTSERENIQLDKCPEMHCFPHKDNILFNKVAFQTATISML